MTKADLLQMYADNDITRDQFFEMSGLLRTLESIVYPPDGPVAETPIRDRVDQVSDAEFYTLLNDGVAAWRAFVVATADAPDDFAVAVL